MTATLRDIRLPLALLGAQHGFDGVEAQGCLRGDALFREGRLVGMTRAAPTPQGGRILLPRLVEVHCHLDKCHTAGRLDAAGGDLAHAIERTRRDKDNWTGADLRARALTGLEEARAAGCALIRSHVDWGDTAAPPLAWHVLQEVAAELPDMTLQLSALTGVDKMADPGFAAAVAGNIPQGQSLGCFVLDHANVDAGLRNVFAQAAARGLALDFHVDEGLSPDLNGLERIADVALGTGHEGPVLCGHACSLIHRGGAEFARIADKLAGAGIAVALLPMTNLYLQGRGTGTPTARGITKAQELVAAGVRVTIGTDNVRDAFCPVGRHDPMRALELAVLAAHLDPPFGRWLPAVTTDAARALGHAPIPLSGARVDDLLLTEARDLAALIAGAPRARLTAASLRREDRR
ncbi:cytosine deaminase [Salinihabitans flavidus]|uniref:Cytosine deaminase n=1 Tax=Salinihabitans flavidus TaxID=569882 RepID=A0A1H8QYF6_9RHOB|nr:amidohydrolase family protein [Salinihabitans flavidus]SEO59262.1 cytosine deaminase [Salinihabitans flavidus]